MGTALDPVAGSGSSCPTCNPKVANPYSLFFSSSVIFISPFIVIFSFCGFNSLFWILTVKKIIYLLLKYINLISYVRLILNLLQIFFIVE
jgi:hypothetical protein